jgi:hypothetical protein
MSSSDGAVCGDLLESSDSLQLSTPPSGSWDDWEIENPFKSEMISFLSRKKDIDYFKTMELKVTKNANNRITFWLVEDETNISHKVDQISNLQDDELISLIEGCERVDVEIADRVKDHDGRFTVFIFSGWIYWKPQGG